MAMLGAVGVRSDPVLSHNFLISLIDTSSSLALAKSLALSAITDVALGGFLEREDLVVRPHESDHMPRDTPRNLHDSRVGPLCERLVER